MQNAHFLEPYPNNPYTHGLLELVAYTIPFFKLLLCRKWDLKQLIKLSSSVSRSGQIAMPIRGQFIRALQKTGLLESHVGSIVLRVVRDWTKKTPGLVP